MLTPTTRTVEECNALAAANLRLVHHVVKLMATTRPDLLWYGREDATSDGFVALTRASRRWDPARGVKFSTYACRSIYHAINDALVRRHRRVATVLIRREDRANSPRGCTNEPADRRAGDDAARLDARLLLSRLGPTDRRLVEEKFLKGRTSEELGRELGRSSEFVNVRIRTALWFLRGVPVTFLPPPPPRAPGVGSRREGVRRP